MVDILYTTVISILDILGKDKSFAWTLEHDDNFNADLGIAWTNLRKKAQGQTYATMSPNDEILLDNIYNRIYKTIKDNSAVAESIVSIVYDTPLVANMGVKTRVEDMAIYSLSTKTINVAEEVQNEYRIKYAEALDYFDKVARKIYSISGQTEKEKVINPASNLANYTISPRLKGWENEN